MILGAVTIGGRAVDFCAIRKRIVDAISLAKQVGGCTGDRVAADTGEVCAIGALTCARLGVVPRAGMDENVAQQLADRGNDREDSVIWSSLSTRLLGHQLWILNDNVDESCNPPVVVLTRLLDALDKALVPPKSPENHEKIEA